MNTSRWRADLRAFEWECGCLQTAESLERCPEHTRSHSSPLTVEGSKGVYEQFLTAAKPMPPTVGASLDAEVRHTDPHTGGQKGVKLARFDMVPPEVLWELAEHYGKGEAKYPSDTDGTPNWQRGYNWRLSVAALHRHLNLFERGEDIDQETKSHHLIAVMWHAAALRWFQLHNKGIDYRNET